MCSDSKEKCKGKIEEILEAKILNKIVISGTVYISALNWDDYK